MGLTLTNLHFSEVLIKLRTNKGLSQQAPAEKVYVTESAVSRWESGSRLPDHLSLLTALPATFMTAVSTTYILMAKEGFKPDQTLSYIIGVVAAASLLIVYLVFLIRKIIAKNKSVKQ